MKLLGLVVMGGCSSAAHGLADARIEVRDSPVDTVVDATPDALPDAAISTSPRCTTTPSILIDTSPRVIGNIARAGDTLYVSGYQTDNTTVSDNALIAIDLTTGVAATPIVQSAQVQLWPAGDNVYMSEYRPDGTIWQLHPGAAPVALVQHLATPTVITADGDYVYWASTSNVVQRRLIAGGPIEMVMPCTDASRLVIDGTDIYCAAGQYVTRALKAGGSIPDEITTMITNYPIVSMIKDGASLYYATLDPFPDLMQINTTTSSASVFYKSPNPGRYTGLAASSDFFYITNQFAGGLQRIERTTHAVETIVVDTGVFLDPVIWNQHVYYESQNPQLSGERYVMQCVD